MPIIEDTKEKLLQQLEFLQDHVKELNALQWAKDKEENELIRLNRELKTISACNQVLVRAKNEFALVQQICDILIDVGTYSMAWIGYPDENNSCYLRTVAFSGADECHLSFSNINLKGEDTELGPTGRAIKYCRTEIVNDTTEDLTFILWKEDAVKHNFRSVISLPLSFEENCFGAITIYSNEPNYFDTNEKNLLLELKNDLAYGIAALRNHEETEKYQSELKKSEENYRNLIEISPNATFVTVNGNCAFINNAALRLIGSEKYSNIIGRPFIDFVHPDYKVSVIKRTTQITSFKIPRQIEIKLINLQNKVIDVLLTSSYMDYKGEPAAQIVLNDITELHQTMNALKESEERFRNLFENAPIGILKTSLKGKIFMANNAMVNMLGYDSFEEFAETPMSDIYKDNKERNKFLKLIKEKKILKGYETVFYKKNGSPIVISSNTRLVYSNNDKEYYIEGAIEDITSRHKIEEELVRAKEKAEEISRMKGNFLANMSHELRTPLVAILGFAEIFQSEFTNSLFKEMADSIFNSGTRLLETLNSILDLSRLEANKIEIFNEEVNVVEIVDEYITKYSSAAIKKNLYLEKYVENDLVKIKTDIQLLQKIIDHVINNALKYTVEGGIGVTVKDMVKNKKRIVAIEICDTGIGIPNENLNTIFEEFRQVSEGINRNYEGTGIGLTITKKFAELLGGTIKVESVKGKGSKFTILIPDKNETPTTEEPEVKLPELNDNKHTSTSDILLVDNDEPTADVTRIILKKFYNLDIASSGQQAIDYVRQKKYNAILMDINLGIGMNGIDTMKHIKKMHNYRDVPVIAFTAYAMSGDREKFLKHGFNEYIAKPFEKNELIGLLDNILKNK